MNREAKMKTINVHSKLMGYYAKAHKRACQKEIDRVKALKDAPVNIVEDWNFACEMLKENIEYNIEASTSLIEYFEIGLKADNEQRTPVSLKNNHPNRIIFYMASCFTKDGKGINVGFDASEKTPHYCPECKKEFYVDWSEEVCHGCNLPLFIAPSLMFTRECPICNEKAFPAKLFKVDPDTEEAITE